jgi:hypothetical protein
MGAKPTKATILALERVFEAEINGLLPFQSKSSIYRDLMAAGLVEPMSRKFGTGWSGVTVSGYALTHSGRFVYCQSCEDVPCRPKAGRATEGM